MAAKSKPSPWDKWAQAFRIAFQVVVLIVLTLVIRWDAWQDAWQQRHTQAILEVQKAYQMGRQDSCSVERQRL